MKASLSSDHFANSFFIHSITSGGWLTTSLARACKS
jgi:hypothetical protein